MNQLVQIKTVFDFPHFVLLYFQKFYNLIDLYLLSELYLDTFYFHIF